MKPWVRKTRLSYLDPFKLGAFCPLGGGSALVLLIEMIFKWIVKRLFGGKVLFLWGVLNFWQAIYNFGNTTLSHIARLLQV